MSGKRPTDHLEPAAKKRGADRQITKDDDDVEDDQEVRKAESPALYSYNIAHNIVFCNYPN